jgi:hypothetical protein
MIEREMTGEFHCRVWLIREELQLEHGLPVAISSVWEEGLENVQLKNRSTAEWAAEDLAERDADFFYNLCGLRDLSKNWQVYIKCQIRRWLGGALDSQERDQDVEPMSAPIVGEVPDDYILARFGEAEAEIQEIVESRMVDRIRAFTELLQSGVEIPVTKVHREDTPDGPLHSFEQTTLQEFLNETRSKQTPEDPADDS